MTTTKHYMMLTQDDFPKSYAACFLDNCALKDQCLHHRYEQLLPSSTTTLTAIRPAALHEENLVDGHCRHYNELTHVTCYADFSHFFDEVRKKDIPTLRQEIYTFLRGRSNFYRYSNAAEGYLLTRPMADRIKAIFAAHGYPEPHYGKSFQTLSFQH